MRTSFVPMKTQKRHMKPITNTSKIQAKLTKTNHWNHWKRHSTTQQDGSKASYLAITSMWLCFFAGSRIFLILQAKPTYPP